MDSVMAVFGRRVRALRKARGLTQEELGKAVHLDYKHIGRLERGEFGASFEAVQRIAKTLQVEYYELFLPTRLATKHLELDLASVVSEVQDVTPKAMAEFLRELLQAVRKLQGSKPG